QIAFPDAWLLLLRQRLVLGLAPSLTTSNLPSLKFPRRLHTRCSATGISPLRFLLRDCFRLAFSQIQLAGEHIGRQPFSGAVYNGQLISPELAEQEIVGDLEQRRGCRALLGSRIGQRLSIAPIGSPSSLIICIGDNQQFESFTHGLSELIISTDSTSCRLNSQRPYIRHGCCSPSGNRTHHQPLASQYAV